jgi:hypothetical protein
MKFSRLLIFDGTSELMRVMLFILKNNMRENIVRKTGNMYSQYITNFMVIVLHHS